MFKNVAKILLVFIPLLVLACTDEPSEKDPTSSVERTYTAGDIEPDAPKQAGKAFLGWYTSKAFTDITKRVDFTKKSGGSFKIYPKWADAKGYTISNDGVLSRILDKKETIVEIPYNVDKAAVTVIGGLDASILGSDFNNANTTATKIYLPSKGVGKIGDYAFYNITKLTSIIVPSTVTSLGFRAFAYTKALTSVTLPDGLTSIGGNSFYLSGLISVRIPSSVTTIGDYAFASCKNLTSFRIEAMEPPTAPPTIFSSTFDFSIKVPPGSAGEKTTTIVQDYQAAAGWSTYSIKISAYTE